MVMDAEGGRGGTPQHSPYGNPPKGNNVSNPVGQLVYDLRNNAIKRLEKDRKRKLKGGKKGGQKPGGYTPGGSSSGGGGNGGGGNGGGGVRYRGFGPPPAVNRKEAANIVQHQIKNSLRELKHLAQGQRRNSAYDINKILAEYGRTRGDLDYIYNEADDFLGAQSQKINDRFNATRGDIQGQYDQFVSQNGDAVAARRAAAAAELNRLGIQQTGLGQFDADAANGASVAGINQQNANANLQAMQSGANEIGDLLGSMSQGARASALGRAVNGRNDAVADTRQSYLQMLKGLQDQANTIRGGKWSAVNDLATQLQQQRFGQFMDYNQAQFSNQMSANNFNLSQSRLNSSNFWQKAQLVKEAAAADQQRRLQQSQGGQQSYGMFG